MDNSQQTEDQAQTLQYDPKEEDLGSRAVLSKNNNLCWFPAEVDVSIRKGWFYSDNENRTVKSAKKLFNIYIKSVGNNCSLLLNIPPSDKGVIHEKDVKSLKNLGSMIRRIESKPVVVEEIGELTKDKANLEYSFDSVKKLNYAVICEDTRFSQRVELFDFYIKKPNGKYKKIYSGTIMGNKKIIPIKNQKAIGAVFVIRQSRSNPIIKSVGLYE